MAMAAAFSARAARRSTTFTLASLQISFVAFAALLASPVVLSNVMVYPLYT
jgi:hypothetical protein